MVDELKIYTDGASRGNPGPASAAYVIAKKDETVLNEGSEFLGETTNNRAEYKAVIKALKMASNYTEERVRVFSDSKLLVKQLQGEWKVKSDNIGPLFEEVKELTRSFDSVSFHHRNRDHEMISRADFLCNRELDRSS
ncbi:MAG: ribonuclease HI family protein [Candidatus Aenigmatarchaeota archaeon]